jgi:D-alanyl-D-alanine carboxypeptidase
MDYLFASLEGEVWVYNALRNTWEVSQETHQEEVIYGGIVENAIFDFRSNASPQKFLDDKHAFSTSYVPQDIVSLVSSEIFPTATTFQLRAEASEHFLEMASAFSQAFQKTNKVRLSITSAYRSPTYQKQLASSCSTARCAKPGTSEHEAGLALDLGVNGGNILGNGGKYYQWLLDNAHLYGFHNTYQKGIEVDGKMVEPRHWRYIGADLATYLHDSQRTISEYFYLLYE